jgi:hypothetical protein
VTRDYSLYENPVSPDFMQQSWATTAPVWA